MNQKNIACLVLVVILLAPSLSIFTLIYEIESVAASEVSPELQEKHDWSMFHKNLMHTGKSYSTAPISNQTLWKFNTGGQVGSPVVEGGLVYVGSYDRKIYALDAK